MFSRLAQHHLADLLAQFPAVVLLGPRQAGKTTLALAESERRCNGLYLDLELPSAQRQLDDAEAFLLGYRNRLVILDEVQRMPGLFAVLRGVIDQRRRDGEAAGQFLMLGSASGVLFATDQRKPGRPSGATGVHPVSSSGSAGERKLLPTSIRCGCAADSHFPGWRRTTRTACAGAMPSYSTYLERDIPALGPRIPATTLRRLWTMLAHSQGSLLNQSQLAAALAVSGQTVSALYRPAVAI